MRTLVSTFLLIAVFLAPVTAQNEGESASTVDALTSAGWTIRLTGRRSHDLQAYEVRKMMIEQNLRSTFETESRGEAVEYSGVTLANVVALVDGNEYEDPWTLDFAAWSRGYEITATAEDGYAATVDTGEFATDALLLAVERNGESIRPRLVSNVSRALQVKDLVSIELNFMEEPDDPLRRAFRLRVTVGGTEHELALEDLKASESYAEGPGGFLTNSGSSILSTYGGVYLRDLLEKYTGDPTPSSVTFVAVDGYEMTYDAQTLSDESEGRWLLAFEENGKPLSIDPGYVRTVKIGQTAPQIPGHLSVKMVQEIRVEDVAIPDFRLSIRGLMDVDLSRTELLSIVNSDGNTVTFEWRGDANEYTGIPLYHLLAFSDDPLYAPHRQDFQIEAYNEAAALSGYSVDIVAADGFTVTVDSREIHDNEDIIVALKKNGEPLPERERPLILVWDREADRLPEGIRNVRGVVTIQLHIHDE